MAQGRHGLGIALEVHIHGLLVLLLHQLHNLLLLMMLSLLPHLVILLRIHSNNLSCSRSRSHICLTRLRLRLRRFCSCFGSLGGFFLRYLPGLLIRDALQMVACHGTEGGHALR